MVATLDYNTVVSEASYDVAKSKDSISLFSKTPSFLGLLLTYVFGNMEKKVTKTIRYQLFMSQWLLTDMKKNVAEIQNKDWSRMIVVLNKGIKLNIEMQAAIEKAITANHDKSKVLEALNESIEETINNFYSCIRMFKKATIKTIHEQPSEIAICAASRSANTINAIYAN